ncbi:hypothetical protein MRX96_007707 [Rhipicephalus microplus]
MSQRSPRIPRKRYLDRDEPFVLPQSTAYWKKQRERSRARDSTSDSFGPGNNAGLCPEDVHPPQADDLVDDDSFGALTHAEGDTDSEASEGAKDEPSSMDETFSDCNESFKSDGDAEIGDESEGVRLTFLVELELVAEKFAHLESQTLPG